MGDKMTSQIDAATEDSMLRNNLSISHLPEDLLLKILLNCSTSDILAASSACKLFYRLTRDELLWKYLCKRDFKISKEDFPGTSSYYSLYSNLLNKYGWMKGLYQTNVGPFGDLMEVRFKNGCIEGVNWEPSSQTDVAAPLQEYVLFSVMYDQNLAKCVCLPDIAPHPCSLTLDKSKSELIQKCSDPECHRQALRNYYHNGGQVIADSMFRMKTIFLDAGVRQEIIHRKFLLPGPQDMPETLRLNDGTFPPHLITPGLYKGTYGVHGTELIMFKYIDENEIHGIKVTGDHNVFAQEITVKILLKYSMTLSSEQQITFESLKAIEPCEGHASISSKDQPFLIPEDCQVEGETLPHKCRGRFHGQGQVAYDGFQDPSFLAAHIMVFDDDLFGVLWLGLRSFNLFQRVERSFSQNILENVKSAI